MKYQNYIFDLDGTLLDTAQDIIESFEIAFKSVLQVEIKLDASMIGPPLVETVKKIKAEVTEVELAKITAEFKNHYDNSYYPNTVLYKNVLSVLKELKKQNFLLFIATNKRRIPTLRILKQFQLEASFTEIMTSDYYGATLLTKTQMIDKLIRDKLIRQQTCFIGDTEGDVKAGINNEIKTYFVTYGYESKSIEYLPCCIIDDIQDVIKWS